MSRCRTSSALALVVAAVGLSGGLATPGAMAALSPRSHHSAPRPALTTVPSTTVPSTAVPSTAVPSTAVPAPTVPSAGVPAAAPTATAGVMPLTVPRPNPPSTAQPTPPVPVRTPTAFSRFTVALDQYGHLGYSGCLGLPAGVPGGVPAQLPGPTIQYAAQPRGPWHALTSATLTSAPCGHGGQEFSGRVTARLNLAYYRAYFPGLSDYLPAASQAVLAWKFADRITAFQVSTASVGQRRSLTVRGTLQYYRFGWHGYQGQTVLAILRPKGQGTWYWIRRLSTGPGGRFSVTLADPLGATWSAEYLGNSTHLATVAAMVYVPLTAR